MTLFVAFLLACYFGGIVLREQHMMVRALIILVAILYLCYAYIIGDALF